MEPNIFKSTKRILESDTNAVQCGPLPSPGVVTKKQKIVQAQQQPAAVTAEQTVGKPLTQAQIAKNQKRDEAFGLLALYSQFIQDGLNGSDVDGDPIVGQYVWFLFKDIIPFFVGSDPARWAEFRKWYDNIPNPGNRFTQDELEGQLQRRHAVYDKYDFLDWVIFLGNGETIITPLVYAYKSLNTAQNQVNMDNMDNFLNEFDNIQKSKAVFKQKYKIFSNSAIINANGILTILAYFIKGADHVPNFSMAAPFSDLISYLLSSSSNMNMKDLMVPCLLFFDEAKVMSVLYNPSPHGVPLFLFCVYLAYAFTYMYDISGNKAIVDSARNSEHGFTNANGRIINNIYDYPSDSYFTVLHKPVVSSVDARVCHPATSTIPWVLSVLNVDHRSVAEQDVKYIAPSFNRRKSTDKKIKLTVDFAIVPSKKHPIFASFSIGFPSRINEIMNNPAWGGQKKQNFLTLPQSGGDDVMGYEFVTMFKRNALFCFSVLVGYLQFDTDPINIADMSKFLAIDPNNPNSAGQFQMLQGFFKNNYQTTAEKLIMFNLFFLKYFKQITTQDKKETTNPVALAIIEQYGYLHEQQ